MSLCAGNVSYVHHTAAYSCSSPCWRHQFIQICRKMSRTRCVEMELSEVEVKSSPSKPDTRSARRTSHPSSAPSGPSTLAHSPHSPTYLARHRTRPAGPEPAAHRPQERSRISPCRIGTQARCSRPLDGSCCQGDTLSRASAGASRACRWDRWARVRSSRRHRAWRRRE